MATLLILAAWTPGVNALGPSDDQRRRLEGGEVVILDILPPGRDAMRASPYFRTGEVDTIRAVRARAEGRG